MGLSDSFFLADFFFFLLRVMFWSVFLPVDFLDEDLSSTRIRSSCLVTGLQFEIWTTNRWPMEIVLPEFAAVSAPVWRFRLQRSRASPGRSFFLIMPSMRKRSIWTNIPLLVTPVTVPWNWSPMNLVSRSRTR